MNKEREKAVLLIKTARGQLDGLLRMIDEDRYCIDLSTQLLATQAVLAKANRHILKGHMESCLKAAFVSSSAEEQEKMIGELMSVMEKM